MPKPSLIQVANEQYEKISEYYLTGREDMLNSEQIAILDRWKSAYGILKDNPIKHVAIAKLRALYPISETQAAADVNNAMKFWSKNNKIDRDFLDAWFINKLLQEITDDDKDEHAKAKNLATLQKYLQTMPAQEIDPRHIEKNNVNICFNIANQNIIINEKELHKLPQGDVTRLLDSLSHEITDVEAEEIMDS